MAIEVDECLQPSATTFDAPDQRRTQAPVDIIFLKLNLVPAGFSQTPTDFRSIMLNTVHLHVVYDSTPLRKGGEKAVYLGSLLQNNTWTPVVVKVLLEPDNPQSIQRFGWEIARLQAVQGPGVATLLAWNLDSRPPFYVEEYFPDGSFADWMHSIFRNGKCLGERYALACVGQILEALARNLHAKNQIHRDIKPANIMLQNGHLIFIDMGFGRTLDRNTTFQTRYFKGTPAYAAPEQEMAEHGFGVDHRSDLYSVGVILHELMTGIRGSYQYQTYSRDPYVRTYLSRLLSPRRKERHPTAKAALQELRRLEHYLQRFQIPNFRSLS